MIHQGFSQRVLFIALTALVLLTLPVAPALARESSNQLAQVSGLEAGLEATFTVNTLNDAYDGVCDTTHCSLREAIFAANAAAGADVIEFSVTGTIMLTDVLPGIITEMVINGPGSGLLTIDGANTFRVLRVNSPWPVTISGLTLAHGISNYGGGMVYVGSSVMYLNDIVFLENQANFRAAGLFINDYTVVLTDSAFIRNTAEAGGAALVNQGALQSTNTSFIENAATGLSSISFGGAIENANGASATISGGVFENNSAEVGGALHNRGTMTLTGSALIDNLADDRAGGINNSGTLTLSDNLITGNGQGLYMTGGTLLATGNTLSNHALVAMVFANGMVINATVGGAPADFNTFSGNAMNIEVSAPDTNPNINAMWNDWGVNALASIEASILDQFDDPTVAQVDYYTLEAVADPLVQYADGASPVVVTATLDGWLNPVAGDVIRFTSTLGSFSPVDAPTDASGQAVSDLTSVVTGTADITVDSLHGLTVDLSAEFIAPVSDVAISKSVQPQGPILPGETLTYTLTYLNQGEGTATGVVITDTLPISLTNASYVYSGAVITDTGILPAYVWQVADLSSGQGGVITITAEVVVPMPASTSIGNLAEISTQTPESDLQNNLSWAYIEVGNAAPQVDVPDQFVDEATLLSFNLGASDPNGDALLYTLDSAPAGAQLDNSGQFTWTPDESQGPGAYTASVTISDGLLSTSVDFTITVYEVNLAPVLDPIGDQAGDELTLITFTASATDSDIPANTLTFSLDAGAPAGASIDPLSGVFTWTPGEDQGPGVYPVTVRVTDNGVPALDDFETIQITVYDSSVDLVLSLTGTFQEAISCTQTTYTLSVTNLGQTDASGVSAMLTLPAGLGFAGSTPACTESAGVVTCDLGDLPAGGAASVALLLDVQGAGLLTTQAEVSANQPDTNPADNQASLDLTGLTTQLVFSDTFEGDPSGNWSSDLTSVTPSGRSFLGEFNNDNVFLALSALPAHCSVNVSFDLFVIRSWDGNQGEWPVYAPAYYGVDTIVGPDQFELLADGQSLLYTTFSNWNALGFRQSYPGTFGSSEYLARSGADENNTLGYMYGTSALDSVYNMSFEFAHLSDLLQMDFNVWGLQAIGDESWGIDNVVITLGSGVTASIPTEFTFFIPMALK